MIAFYFIFSQAYWHFLLFLHFQLQTNIFWNFKEVFFLLNPVALLWKTFTNSNVDKSGQTTKHTIPIGRNQREASNHFLTLLHIFLLKKKKITFAFTCFCLRKRLFFPTTLFFFFLLWMVSIAAYLSSVYLEIHSVFCHF